MSFDKIIVLGVIAAMIVGPTRLPGYAAKLAQFVKMLSEFANTAKGRVQSELGPEFDDLDWKKLDPRQYDPRRIIREALLDDGRADPTGEELASPAQAQLEPLPSPAHAAEPELEPLPSAAHAAEPQLDPRRAA